MRTCNTVLDVCGDAPGQAASSCNLTHKAALRCSWVRVWDIVFDSLAEALGYLLLHKVCRVCCSTSLSIPDSVLAVVLHAFIAVSLYKPLLTV